MYAHYETFKSTNNVIFISLFFFPAGYHESQATEGFCYIYTRCVPLDPHWCLQQALQLDNCYADECIL